LYGNLFHTKLIKSHINRLKISQRRYNTSKRITSSNS